MLRLTIDTNLIDDSELFAAAMRSGADVAAVTVSRREAEGTSFKAHLTRLGSVPEPMVWGEGAWGEGLWGGGPDAVYRLENGSIVNGNPLEAILAVISNSSFPKPGFRDPLTSGQRRQLRDAMILCAHVQHGRDVFVSLDNKAYFREGRRARLELVLGTRIMTREEALILLQEPQT